MRFTPILATAAFVGTTLAEPAYNCDGQDLCGSQANFVKWCDQTVNEDLIRNDDLNYGSPDELPESGECRGSVAGTGCGVFIRGPSECKFSGNQIWNDYQEIRDSGCGICGYKEYDDGCEVVVDYVSGC